MNISLELTSLGTSQNFDKAFVTLTIEPPFFPAMIGTRTGPGMAASGSDTYVFEMQVPVNALMGCFQAAFGGLIIFNSGDISLPAGSGSYPIGYFVMDETQSITPAGIGLPSFPITSSAPVGTVAIKSGTVSFGSGLVTVTGAFTWNFDIGSISGTYTYTFNLMPTATCASPATILTVANANVSLSVNYGWLGDLIFDILEPIIASSFLPKINAAAQTAITAAVAKAFGSAGAPPGTTACVTAVNISAGVIEVAFTAAVPVASVCPSNSSSGG